MLMAIIVTCQCGKQLRAKDEHAGMKATCPACRRLIVIPRSTPEKQSSPSASASPSSLPPGMPPVPDDLSFLNEKNYQSKPSREAYSRYQKKFDLTVKSIKQKPWLLVPIISGGLIVLLLIGWMFSGSKSEYHGQQFIPYSSSSSRNEPDACGACAGCGATFSTIVLAMIILNIMLLVWVARDAKARGMDGGVWLLVILLTGLIGLIIYAISRPQGNLVPCAKCANKRLQASAMCPHCGNP
jgi:hypothetical protein